MSRSDKQFKKNQIVTVRIDDLTDLGFGVGRIGNAVIFVNDAIPGDEAEVRIIKVNSSYLVGRIEKRLTESPLRVTDRCTEGCRSCAYRAVPYSYEARLKEEAVHRCFSSKELKDIEISPIVTSPKEKRYRNKAQYPVSIVNGEYAAGFYAPKSHRVTPVFDCPLTPAVFSEIVAEVLAFLKEKHISLYDEQSGEGLVRHIYLRRGEVSGEILLTVVVTSPALPCKEELAQRITARFPAVVGVLLNVNPDTTNVVLGDEYITLLGRDHIFDTLGGVRLKITAPSFYQVNHDCTEILYAKARELAAPTSEDLVLDLFCGAGSIGLSMAKDAKEVIGIEIVDSAVKCAIENAAANGIENASFYTGDAAEVEDLLKNAEEKRGESIRPDIVILDPPRGGCDERTVRFVASLSPRRVVYVSCNPKTLARDVILFRKLGFSPSPVTPVDMFPGTGHVETIVCLDKQ